jgi:hypothetical protein
MSHALASIKSTNVNLDLEDVVCHCLGIRDSCCSLVVCCELGRTVERERALGHDVLRWNKVEVGQTGRI